MALMASAGLPPWMNSSGDIRLAGSSYSLIMGSNLKGWALIMGAASFFSTWTVAPSLSDSAVRQKGALTHSNPKMSAWAAPSLAMSSAFL